MIYEIKEYNSPGETIFKEAAATMFRKTINEFGRTYRFSIQAFDKEGFGSDLIEKEISVPQATVIIAQQLGKSIFDQGTGNGEFSQRLGNGLTGSPDSVTVHLRFPSASVRGTYYTRAEFWESDNGSYDNSKRVSFSHCQMTDGHGWIIDSNCPNFNFEFDVDKDYTIPVSESFVFDPNKYYKIRFVTYQSQSDFYGSASDDSYDYGYAAIEGGGERAPSQFPVVKDLYFIIKSKPPIELPVPISLLAPQNFNVDFSPDDLELLFNWGKPRYFDDTSSTTLFYKIIDASANSTSSVIETTDYSARLPIQEVGRDYQFNIRAFDENGQESFWSKRSCGASFIG